MGIATAGHDEPAQLLALADDEFAVRHEGRPALENTAHAKVSRLAIERRDLLDEPAHHVPILIDARRGLAVFKFVRLERERLRLPAAKQQPVDLGAQIKRRVRHAHDRQIRVHAVGVNTHEIFVSYRENREAQTGHLRDVPGVCTGAIDDRVAGDRAPVGVDPGYAAVLRADALDRHAGGEAGTGLAGTMRVSHREVVGLKVAVAWAPQHRLGR